MTVRREKESDGFFPQKDARSGKKTSGGNKGGDSGLENGSLTLFSQVLVKIPDQAEGNQASGTTGAVTGLVLLPQRGLKLCPQLPGQLLWLQLPARAQSAHQPVASNQTRRHLWPTLRSGDPQTWTSASRAPEGARSSGGGAQGQGGGPRRGAVWGGGGPPPGRRSGPVVSSPAGARVGHGGLCGPAGPGRGQPLVVSVADRGPGAEAALCGGWSWGLPTSGDHDAEAPLVPVRDGARGRGPDPRERVPGQGGGQEAGPAEGDWSCTRERVPSGSRPALPGTCARSRERSVVQSPGLCGVGFEGQLLILPE